MLAAVVLVIVVVIAIVLRSLHRTSPPAMALHLERHPAAPSGRALVATVGDDITARADGAEAIWVYRDTTTLVARCPGAPGCRTTTAQVELTFRIAAPGRYRVLAVVGADDLVPSGDLDRDVLDARRRGARLELRAVVVPNGP